MFVALTEMEAALLYTEGWMQFLTPYDVGRLTTVCDTFAARWRDVDVRQAAAAMVPILEDEVVSLRRTLLRLEERNHQLLQLTKRLFRRVEARVTEVNEMVRTIRTLKEQVTTQCDRIRTLEVAVAWETRLRVYLMMQMETGRPIPQNWIQMLREDPGWVEQENRLRSLRL